MPYLGGVHGISHVHKFCSQTNDLYHCSTCMGTHMGTHMGHNKNLTSKNTSITEIVNSADIQITHKNNYKNTFIFITITRGRPKAEAGIVRQIPYLYAVVVPRKGRGWGEYH